MRAHLQLHMFGDFLTLLQVKDLFLSGSQKLESGVKLSLQTEHNGRVSLVDSPRVNTVEAT